MKKILVASLMVILPVMAFAAVKNYKVKSGDTWQKIADLNGVSLTDLVNANQPSRGSTIKIPVPDVPTPTPTPVPTPTGDEKIFTAYITGYGYPDNDPANSDTTWNSGIGGHAGGTGTYTDPITLAVGYVGQKSDYPYGTMFYIPNVKAYFKVQDTCASCHRGQGGLVWLDMWHGGNGFTKAPVIACEEKHTGNYTVIQNPAPNYAVVAGSLYDGSCRENFGNTPVVQ